MKGIFVPFILIGIIFIGVIILNIIEYYKDGEKVKKMEHDLAQKLDLISVQLNRIIELLEEEDIEEEGERKRIESKEEVE